MSIYSFWEKYYYGDYRLIATTTNTAFEMTVGPTTSFNLASPGLYNGNIRHAVYTIARLKHGVANYPEPEGYATSCTACEASGRTSSGTR